MKTYKILAVDPNTEDLVAIKETLNETDCQVFCTNTVRAALRIILEHEINLVITSLLLPNSEGHNLLHKLKDNSKTSNINLIFVSDGPMTDDNVLKGFEEGAIDFIQKPLHHQLLRAKIAVFKKMYFKRIKLVNQKEEIEHLIHNILPKQTIQELRETGRSKARFFNMASVMFTDFTAFTKITETLTPEMLVEKLNRYFSAFDYIIENFYLEKIKTIGDAYMCVGGVPIRNKSNPIYTVLAAFQIQSYMTDLAEEQQAKNQDIWQLRIGIHTGPLVAGVVGRKKWQYDVWGDTVNTASRTESSCEPGRVNITGDTYEHIKEFFDCEYRGKIEAKHKGKMDMYYVNRIKEEYCSDVDGWVINKKFKERLSEF